MSQEIQQADNGEYLPEKPLEQRKRELAIRRSLLEQGVDRKIADAVVGYTPEQVPFIYKAESHEVLHHRVRDNWIEGYELIPGESSLWIGTTDAIHNLVDSQGWRDQISEVIVQWRGSHIEESDQQPEVSKVTRSEAHPIEGGAFVLIEYKGVSDMGQFDGEIGNISLYVPEEKFRPYGGSKERMSYRIYGFKRERFNKDVSDVPGGVLNRPNKEMEAGHEWSLQLGYSNTSGTTILNGFSEMVDLHMGEISPIKADHSKAFRYTSLPQQAKQSLISSGTIKDECILLLNEEPDGNREIVESLLPRAKAMMMVLAPMVQKVLADGGYSRQTESMAIDGIMNHSDKIRILHRSLVDFSREDRFTYIQY